MKRFAAFLRGVSPMNCKMQELAKAFAAAGFTDVKTVLSSGNVVFTASGAERSIQKKAEAAMEDHMGKAFAAFMRSLRGTGIPAGSRPLRSIQAQAGRQTRDHISWRQAEGSPETAD